MQVCWSQHGATFTLRQQRLPQPTRPAVGAPTPAIRRPPIAPGYPGGTHGSDTRWAPRGRPWGRGSRRRVCATVGAPSASGKGCSTRRAVSCFWLDWLLPAAPVGLRKEVYGRGRLLVLPHCGCGGVIENAGFGGKAREAFQRREVQMGGSLEGGDAVVLAVDLDPGVLFDTRGSRVETAPPCCSVHPPEPRPRYSLHLALGCLLLVARGGSLRSSRVNWSYCWCSACRTRRRTTPSLVFLSSP